jgi:hypothetical protein
MAFLAAILTTAMNSSLDCNRNIPDVNRGLELFRQFKYLIADYGQAISLHLMGATRA